MAGKLVELGDTVEVFHSPIYPYTATLLSSFPSVRGEKRPLASLLGEPPNLIEPPPGCRFHPYATEVCRREEPPIIARSGHWAAAGTRWSASRDWRMPSLKTHPFIYLSAGMKIAE